MKGNKLRLLLLVGIVAAGCMGKNVVPFPEPGTVCAAAVGDFKKLKEELESPGRAEIVLKNSIVVEETIYAKGEKTLDGGGHTLRRFQGEKGAFGGTILDAGGGCLTLCNVVLSGKGRDIYGRLLDVSQGEVVLERGAVLMENSNDKKNNDGGGAIRIRCGGSLVMKEGTIRDNQNVYGGAGVHVETGGSFIIKKGTIADNRTEGIGAVEGFDGRGGAIFNQGKTTISGGLICNNRVKGYTSGGMDYGGVGGMLYNQGECWIQGGRMTGNSASYGGGAVYNDQASKLHITGGTIWGNDADLGEGLFLAGGSCKVGGTIRLSSVYLIRGSTMVAENSLLLKKGQISLVLERYDNGICLVKTEGRESVAKMFSLADQSKYELVCRKKGLYTSKREKKGNVRAEKPVRDKAVAKEAQGGKERTERKKSEEKRIADEKKRMFVDVAPRYLFVREVENYTEGMWRRELLAGCKIQYGDKKKEEINHIRWYWDGILENRAGNYRVEMYVGKERQAVIPVTLVAENAADEKTGHVRFHSVDGFVETEYRIPQETWHFGENDIRAARTFMRKREDPFSMETNRMFLFQFQRCRTGSEDWGEKDNE